MPILVPEPHDEVCFREDGKRLDGRAVDELRPFSCEVGVIKNAQGSALVRHGRNLIYAAIYGPREVHPRHLARPDRGILRVYYRMATFSVHERKSPAPNRRENEISKVIREALEPVLFLEAYPDSQIEVYIEVIAADGGTRCASTTAASLALADAGIPMRSMVVGVAAGKAQGKVILDLGDKEDKVGQADIPCVVVMKDKSISLLQFDGEMTLEEMKIGFEYVLKGAEVIYQKQLEALREKYNRISRQAELEDKEIPKEISQQETPSQETANSKQVSENVESNDVAQATEAVKSEQPADSSEEPPGQEDKPVEPEAPQKEGTSSSAPISEEKPPQSNDEETTGDEQ